MLDVGGEQLQGRVIRRATEPDGTKKGMAHRNPLFDTRAYLVEFKDGSVAEYTANIIAETYTHRLTKKGTVSPYSRKSPTTKSIRKWL